MNPIDTEISESGDVTLECVLDAPPEKVWRALTLPDFVGRWLGACPDEERSGSAVPEPSYEIVEADPFSRLCYRWHGGTMDEAESFVTFELRPCANGGTWFRLVHARQQLAIQPANGNSPPLAMAA